MTPRDSQTSPEKAFLQDAFRQYYASSSAKQRVSIPSIDSREFGAGVEKKIDYRHKSFADLASFTDFLSRQAPLYVSYSTARYRFPSAKPMAKKIFLGADLVFDLDRMYESEPHPRSHNSLACAYCLQRAREDAARFYDEFLLSDFGFLPSEVSITYSGSKGFHFHIRSPGVQQLSADARRQLCEYAAAYEVDASSSLFPEPIAGKASHRLRGPGARDAGWRRKVLHHVLSFLSSSDEAAIRSAGVRGKKVQEVLEKKQFIKDKLLEGNWSAVSGLDEFWKSVVAASIARVRVETDAPVSFDLSRLIRVPNSLHGDTGFIALTLATLDSFDPLVHAVAFPSGEKRILPLVSGECEVGGQVHEVIEGKPATLPLCAAVLLLAKKKALLTPQSGEQRENPIDQPH